MTQLHRMNTLNIRATHPVAPSFREGIGRILALFFSRDPACWPGFGDPVFSEVVGFRKKKMPPRERVREFPNGETLLHQIHEQDQLDEIVRLVPAKAVTDLRKAKLWMNPEHPGGRPRAVFHPGARWLRENGRDPAMAKGVEFTNVRIFEEETRRMPAFTLHELAHAYYNGRFPMGFGNPEIKAAYEKAKASGKYEHVERKDSEGSITLKRAYAMENPQEYFAESTEACFSRNDFFPFTRAELKQHDPEMFALLEKLWNEPTE